MNASTTPMNHTFRRQNIDGGRRMDRCFGLIHVLHSDNVEMSLEIVHRDTLTTSTLLLLLFYGCFCFSRTFAALLLLISIFRTLKIIFGQKMKNKNNIFSLFVVVYLHFY